MKENCQICKTKDYSKFKILGGNRCINLNNANKIIKSMQRKYIMNPIIVNEKGEIIDGQHRFFAEKELGLDVYYIVQKGLKLEDCQRLNSDSKTWSSEDYLNSYCELGNEQYIKLRKFKNENKHLSLQMCMLLLADNVQIGTILQDKFKSGKYEVKDLEKAILHSKMMKDFKDYIPYGNKLFFLALCIIFETNNYNHEKMLNKLSQQTSKLQKEITRNAYIEKLCAIYNYRTKESDRIEINMRKINQRKKILN